MQCANCGNDLKQGARFCGNCGAQFMLPPPVQPAETPTPASITGGQPQPVPSTQNAGPPPAYAVPKQPRSGFSVTSLILGIVSILSFIIWFISIPFAIAAIVFGFIGKPKGSPGMALAGIIMGIIGIILSVAFVIWALNYLEDNPEEAKKYNYNSISPSSTVSAVKSYSLSAANMR
ncbi:MAG: zinc-ribbon domain-containing protein [Candidatus Saccharimonadales bacterium]